MARFLVVLDPNASQAQRDGAVAAITGNGGEVVAVFDPIAVVAEGDASVQSALSALEGNGVLATDTNGSLDPASLQLERPARHGERRGTGGRQGRRALAGSPRPRSRSYPTTRLT